MAARIPSSMPIADSCSSSASDPNVDTHVIREPASVGSNTNRAPVVGRSVLGVPSGRAKPSTTSNECGASTATHSQ